MTMKNNIDTIVNHAEVSEKAIEAYLVQRCEAHGLVCLKYSNPNMVGYPDRLILLPGGLVSWVELKSKGKKPRKIQELRHKKLRDMGHDVWIVASKLDVDIFIYDYRTWLIDMAKKYPEDDYFNEFIQYLDK